MTLTDDDMTWLTISLTLKLHQTLKWSCLPFMLYCYLAWELSAAQPFQCCLSLSLCQCYKAYSQSVLKLVQSLIGRFLISVARLPTAAYHLGSYLGGEVIKWKSCYSVS